ncbi:hypothetical protein FGB62_131g018 [Gracilaria domingensis]|nr:hypothetical protein FGB62_131g018 [Gracilaria domingensis]
MPHAFSWFDDGFARGSASASVKLILCVRIERRQLFLFVRAVDSVPRHEGDFREEMMEHVRAAQDHDGSRSSAHSTILGEYRASATWIIRFTTEAEGSLDIYRGFLNRQN